MSADVRERAEWIDAGPLSALRRQGVSLVPIGVDEQGYPREAIVVFRGQDGPWVYLNLCKHLPIPLGFHGADITEGDHLICLTHGALFQFEDGYCVAGPCREESLDPLPFKIEEGQLWVPAWYGE